MERKMRRFRQELPAEESLRILRDGAECVLAVDGDDGYPYAVPINYVYDGECIYLHSASQGHKIDALKRNPRLSLCVIDKADIIPEEFTTYFRSVIVFGIARFVDDEQLKIEALRKLAGKYSVGIDPTDEINRFLKAVTVIEISIDRITGKEAIELTRQR
ncbi:MAG: pyridoxamine 5'-phosphate oxidase family protein [Muribaculaceae bacterium]|nr:pyridoxamine 5'-phosphate oxidase family protein [Muribaculaceae bacterium]